MAQKNKTETESPEMSISHEEVGPGIIRVGIQHLSVFVTHDDASWFAQGMEVDYFTEGASLEDVQERFERGLEKTIDLHLKAYGDANRLFVPAPAEIWKEFLSSATGGDLFAYTQVTEHRLPERFYQRFPFTRVRYFPQKKAA